MTDKPFTTTVEITAWGKTPEAVQDYVEQSLKDGGLDYKVIGNKK